MRSTLFITTLLLAQLVSAQTSRIKHLKESDRIQANTFACHFFDRNTKSLPPPPSAINDEQAEPWKHVQTSLDLAPTYVEAISEKGLVWMERGRYDSAIIYCARAIEREPYIGLLRLNLAKVHYFNKSATLAKPFLQDALFCKPVFPEAYLFIAQVNLDERKWQEALLNNELALRMNPDKEPLRARLLVTHAEALFGLSRFKDAFVVLKKAREVDPKNLKSFILFDEYKKRAGD